ncbi:MAG: CpsD/CapB family tyrosine-protein kinase [Desulfobacterales bacterium]|nr:CpsD/CapB family tyrosine-protein kinase [Desulfobacterales bacterium]
MKLRKALDLARSERIHIPEPACEPDVKNAGCWQKPGENSPNSCPLDPVTAAKNRGVCLNPNPDEIERYKILRTRINHMARQRKMNTIMITSPNQGEGKTVTSINMGFTFARAMNQTALLVDCDFKGQDIHKYLGIYSDTSLIDYFLDDKPIKDLILWPGVEKLSLISGDRTVHDSTELLSSEMMAQLVEEMGSRYDDRYVLFDAPPVLEQSEAISLAPLMDGILMVVESGRTSKTDIRRALELLPKEKFLGFVFNKQAA